VRAVADEPTSRAGKGRRDVSSSARRSARSSAGAGSVARLDQAAEALVVRGATGQAAQQRERALAGARRPTARRRASGVRSAGAHERRRGPARAAPPAVRFEAQLEQITVLRGERPQSQRIDPAQVVHAGERAEAELDPGRAQELDLVLFGVIFGPRIRVPVEPRRAGLVALELGEGAAQLLDERRLRAPRRGDAAGDPEHEPLPDARAQLLPVCVRAREDPRGIDEQHGRERVAAQDRPGDRREARRLVEREQDGAGRQRPSALERVEDLGGGDERVARDEELDLARERRGSTPR
jgi:hypothetical protein